MRTEILIEPGGAPAFPTQPQSFRQSEPLLRVDRVTLEYDAAPQVVTAVSEVSFQLQASDRLILLGPSGCGKSTLLKAVAGFIRPVAGKIMLHGREVRHPGPDRVVVFQEFEQLLPWKTVKENVLFALVASGRMRASEAEELAMIYVKKVNLEKFANAYPHTLSGGMKQRVAIARCLAMNPEIILMDEPFAALDAFTRRHMQSELRLLWEESRFTMLFVTHSIPEAMALGNRIVLLSAHPGRVREEISVHLPLVEDERTPEFTELHEHIQKLLFEGQADYAI
jgi:NitT/TauT family transport system ATP-binding protein